MSALDRLQLIQNAVTRLTLMYRALYGQAPAYVAELLQPYLSACSLRSNMLNLLSVPHTRLKTPCDRAFESVAPKLWNSLPLPLRSAVSVDSLKIR